jgi:hypothetical protein
MAPSTNRKNNSSLKPKSDTQVTITDKEMLLLKKSATIHPGLESMVFHNMQPNILRNVYKDFYLYELTPEEIRRPYDVSIPESEYKYPRCMNVTYFYRYNYQYGYEVNGNHKDILCNEAVVRRMMFHDFWFLFVKIQIPPFVSELTYRHGGCDGIRAKEHKPFKSK